MWSFACLKYILRQQLRQQQVIKLPFLGQGLADSFINSYTIIHTSKSL